MRRFMCWRALSTILKMRSRGWPMNLDAATARVPRAPWEGRPQKGPLRADVGAEAGQTARDLFELTRPEVDWLRVAGSMGVEAARAETLENLADLLRGAFTRKGPFLIELVL